MAAGSRFRARKLGVKQSLAVLREADLDVNVSNAASVVGSAIEQSVDAAGLSLERLDSITASLPKLETGVESKEEKVWSPSAPFLGGSLSVGCVSADPRADVIRLLGTPLASHHQCLTGGGDWRPHCSVVHPDAGCSACERDSVRPPIPRTILAAGDVHPLLVDGRGKRRLSVLHVE